MKGHGMSEARSVLGVICSFYDSFFEAEKKIADYIICLLYTSPSPRD